MEGDLLLGDMVLDECFAGRGALIWRAVNEAYAAALPGYNRGTGVGARRSRWATGDESASGESVGPGADAWNCAARCAAGCVAVGAAPGVAPSRYPRGSMVVRPPSLVLRVVALLERGLPPGLLADNETRRRSLLIVGTIWVLVIACVFTIPVLLGTTRGGARIVASVVNLGTISVALGALGLLRRRGTRGFYIET